MAELQNPFLRGLLASQMAGERSTANQIGAMQGLLSVQNQMQMAPIQRELSMLQLERARQGPAPKWQVAERFNEQTGQPEKVIVDLNNPMTALPFGGQKTQPQQLVNVPVPGQPGVTQPTWMRPGEGAGMAVGGPAMPEILNRDVQAAKLGIAAAGRPSVNVKVDAKMGESFAKEIAPMMGESRSAAVGALGAVDTAGRIRSAIEGGNVNLGPTATVRNKVDQLSQLMGVGGGTTEERLVNTRNVIRGLSQFAVAARKQLKGQGQVSDYEGKLIQRAEAGEIEDFTIPELRDFVNVTEKLARQTYGEHQRQIGIMQQNPELQRFVPFYQTPEMSPEGATPTPQRRSSDKPGAVRRYNPATGKIE